MSSKPSSGSIDGPNRAQAPSDNRDSPALTVCQSNSTGQQTQPRRSELPDGDSITLRLARRIGLR